MFIYSVYMYVLHVYSCYMFLFPFVCIYSMYMCIVCTILSWALFRVRLLHVYALACIRAVYMYLYDYIAFCHILTFFKLSCFVLHFFSLLFDA